MDFPRYKPKRLRPLGAGAFSDYVAAVAQRDAKELKSCRMNRQWRKKAGFDAETVLDAEAGLEEKETDPA